MPDVGLMVNTGGDIVSVLSKIIGAEIKSWSIRLEINFAFYCKMLGNIILWFWPRVSRCIARNRGENNVVTLALVFIDAEGILL